MAETRRSSWRRLVNRRLLFISAIAGMLIVYSSVIVLQDDYARIFAVTTGLIILELGVWYAASPFLTSERRYLALRQEVESFVYLVRDLNRVVVQNAGTEERQRIKSEMLESVERMDQLAGVEGRPAKG